MKAVFTFSKKIIENGKLIAVGSEEIVSENVAKFTFDESTQKIHVHYNGQEGEETFDLMKGDDAHSEQWYLLNINCFQVAMKV